MKNQTVIRKAIRANSKYVYFGAQEQVTISWDDVPCYIVDVASKPYFEVGNFPF